MPTGWREDGPAGPSPITAVDILAYARARPRGTARDLLAALCCVDAARWTAFPETLAGADALEAELLATGLAPSDDGPGQLLAHTLAARRAIRAADRQAGYDAAAEVLGSLPSGYPFKSRWLHWRDLFVATGRCEAWQSVRRRLAAELQAGGVPPSETLPALLGRLDLRRWRTETRLSARMEEQLLAAVEAALPLLPGDAARRSYRAAAGRELVRLGDEARGAELLHSSVEDLRTHWSRPGRLFSRPAPEAALWARSAIERASASRLAGREGLVHHAVLTLCHLARRHRAEHLLREALDPVPHRFARHDVAAHVLLEGALAWLCCGNRWRGHEWFLTGLRQLGRQPSGPMAGEAGLRAVEWAALSGEESALASAGETARRLSGPASLEVLAEVARVRSLFGDDDGAWEQLGGVFRLALSPRGESPARALLACGSTLLAWGLTGSGLSLIREALAAGQPLALRLPAGPGGDTVDPDEAARLLRELLGAGMVRHEPAATAMRMLCARGQQSLAVAAWEAANAAIERLDAGGSRLRASILVARNLAAGISVDLRADVDQALADEAAAILERLRIDDPPG